MIKLTTRILFLAVSAWWVVGSLGCAANTPTPPAAAEADGDTIRPFGLLLPGEAADALLPTTVPGEAETDPLLVLDVTFFDEFTGEPLAGDVTVTRAGITGAECHGQLRCVLAVRPSVDEPWLIEVQAAGYAAQKLELTANTLSSRTLEMPIRLRPVGSSG